MTAWATSSWTTCSLATSVSTSADTVALGSNYDYNGNRTSLWVNIGGSATISRDAVTGFTGGTDDFTNSYVFDALGNMTSVSQTSQSSGNGVTAKTAAFAYDGDTRLTGVNLAQGNQVASAAYTYDADSELTDLTYVDGSGDPLAGYHWDYDADSRVSDMLQPQRLLLGHAQHGLQRRQLGQDDLHLRLRQPTHRHDLQQLRQRPHQQQERDL